MTKPIAALCILLLSIAKVPAQDITKNFCRQFGIKLGMNVSQIKFTHTTLQALKYTGQMAGVTAGAFLTVPVAGKLSFQPEYLYSVIGGKISRDTTYQLSYLSMPLLLKYNIYKKWTIVAGSTLDLLLWARQKTGTTIDITQQIEERHIAATGGLEWQFLKSVGFMVRYMTGLNDVDQPLLHREFRNQSVQLTASVHW